MPIYWERKNENLHSGVWVRRLGVCQSYEKLHSVEDIRGKLNGFCWGLTKNPDFSGDGKMRILTRLENRENSGDLYRGSDKGKNLNLLENKEGSDGFCRELRMIIFDLQGIKNSDKIMLGSNEAFGHLIGESRMRIFILLGSKNSVGNSYTAGE